MMICSAWAGTGEDHRAQPVRRMLVLESCRVRGGGLPGDGVLSCGARRVLGRAAESFRSTEGFRRYHADNFPCCGNSPPGGRQVSVIMDRGGDHQAPGATGGRRCRWCRPGVADRRDAGPRPPPHGLDAWARVPERPGPGAASWPAGCPPDRGRNSGATADDRFRRGDLGPRTSTARRPAR